MYSSVTVLSKREPEVSETQTAIVQMFSHWIRCVGGGEVFGCYGVGGAMTTVQMSAR